MIQVFMGYASSRARSSSRLCPSQKMVGGVLLLSSVMTFSFMTPVSAGLTLPFTAGRLSVRSKFSIGRLRKSPEWCPACKYRVLYDTLAMLVRLPVVMRGHGEMANHVKRVALFIRVYPAVTLCASSTSSSPSATNNALFRQKGGASSTSKSAGFSFSSLWGVLGVLAILGNAVRRLLPIALEPFKLGNFTPLLWAQFVSFSLFMAYAEGYKGFHKKFSPLVVRRAYTLGPGSPLLHKIFAAPYSMGLFHASRKRKIVSWGLAVGIFALIKLVKSLAYPYRSIVDAGVVVGLTLGATSIAGHYTASLMGKLPEIDPALPETASK